MPDRTQDTRTPLVVGVGNLARGDDGVGIHVLERLRERLDAGSWTMCACLHRVEGDPLALLDAWQDRRSVVLIDAIRTGASAGAILRLDASCQPLPSDLRTSTSTHAVGIAETIELARSLRRLPPTVVLYGVTGERFQAGGELSTAVGVAVDACTERVMEEALALAAPRSSDPPGAAAARRRALSPT